MAAKVIPFPLHRRRAQIAAEPPRLELIHCRGFVGLRIRPPGYGRPTLLRINKEDT